jgi:hypothetical protein
VRVAQPWPMKIVYLTMKTQQDIINENIIQQYEIRVRQDDAKINALENVIVKMTAFVPMNERELFLKTLSSEEYRRLEVAEIVGMIKGEIKRVYENK